MLQSFIIVMHTIFDGRFVFIEKQTKKAVKIMIL